MGYRNYFYSLPIEDYEKIKDLDQKGLKKLYGDENDDDDYFWVMDITNLKEVYGFGKYCDFDISHTLSNFFTDSIMNDNDMEFEFANRETFRLIIENYVEKIKLMYKELIDKNDPNELLSHVKSMNMEWLHEFAVDLNRDVPSITSSWKYEYGLFELIRIYKTFDFKTHVLIYVGY
jgi:hypothetical protein